ncbi:hypothetical protein, partial [Salmonella sp. s54836]|uniref:hypothetical protein n=1 Tax=Salmonella sp. s54836 TaxID=3159673 RepID=UPI003980CFA9
LAGYTGTYTVRATSCVGSSVSSEKLFTPPNPPGRFDINLSITCSPSTMEADVNTTVGPVSSDRGTTNFTLYINDQLEDDTTDITNYYFYKIISLPNDNKIISVTMNAYSCAGSTASTVQSNKCADPVVLSLSNYGIIGIVVGGFFL